MRKSLIAVAGTATAVGITAFVMTANANVKPACTQTGVTLGFVGFNGYHEVPWNVKFQGATVASGVAKFTGSTSFPVDLDVPANSQVQVTGTWGKTPRDTQTITTPAKCLDTNTTTTATVGTTTSTTTTVPTVTTPTTTAPTTSPKPPKPPKRKDCKFLLKVGAGKKTLVKHGCWKPAVVCKVGEDRRAVQVGGQWYVTCIPPGRGVMVTG